MRNVIKNILTRWKNPFGKQEQYSYSFITTHPHTDIYIQTSTDVPVKIREAWYLNGEALSSTSTFTEANYVAQLGGVADLHSIQTITVLSGTISYLEVGGEVIFDNR